MRNPYTVDGVDTRLVEQRAWDDEIAFENDARHWQETLNPLPAPNEGSRSITRAWDQLWRWYDEGAITYAELDAALTELFK